MANSAENLMFSETRIGNVDLLASYLKTNSKNINLAHINTCSINPKKHSDKIDFFKLIPNVDKLDVLALTETYL